MELNSLPVSVIPPEEEMRMTVDKVARYVASIKPRLERVIDQNAGMRNYGFLNAEDPYHAYYQQRLSEFRAQNPNVKDDDDDDDYDYEDENDRMKMIRKWFQINETSNAVTNTVIVSPITGELITVKMLRQHMQDPKYKEQKETLFAKIRETTHAQDDKILRSFICLARKRPSIFEKTEEQICYTVMKEIDPFLILDDPQPRLDDSLLVPEDPFLAQNSDSLAICGIFVYVPQKVQLLEITVESLSESVGSFKEKIAQEIDVPAAKLKLELEHLPGLFKDDLSLAYYNVAGATVLSASW